MASTPNVLVIRPVCLQDARALWTIAREQGVIETTLALPSLRLEQDIAPIFIADGMLTARCRVASLPVNAGLKDSTSNKLAGTGSAPS